MKREGEGKREKGMKKEKKEGRRGKGKEEN